MDEAGAILSEGQTFTLMADGAPATPENDRSEEHTLNSSHTVTSYAVFCLKKKKSVHERTWACALVPPLSE